MLFFVWVNTKFQEKNKKTKISELYLHETVNSSGWYIFFVERPLKCPNKLKIVTDITRWKIVHAKIIRFFWKKVFLEFTIHQVKNRNCLLNFISNFFLNLLFTHWKNQNIFWFFCYCSPSQHAKTGQLG